VHLRRALLLFALVLGLTALAASIAPAPRRDEDTVRPAPTPAGPAPAQVSISFHAAVAKRAPPARRVDPGAHLTVAVAAARPGQAEIPRLGLTATVTRSAPAQFDLLAPDDGRSDVLFRPTTGQPRRVGTLVSRRARR
jgi:hypothetical protein